MINVIKVFREQLIKLMVRCEKVDHFTYKATEATLFFRRKIKKGELKPSELWLRIRKKLKINKRKW